MLKHAFLLLCLVFPLTIWSCSNKKSNTQKDETEQSLNKSTDSGLTAFQMKNGIGPITEEVKVGPINKDLVAKGKDLFENKCTGCHKIGQRYVGPDLKEVTSRRTPTYIMNMMMNPTGMTHDHPVAHKLLEKFATQMANMHVSRDQARAIVEYLRSVNPNTKE